MHNENQKSVRKHLSVACEGKQAQGHAHLRKYCHTWDDDDDAQQQCIMRIKSLRKHLEKRAKRGMGCVMSQDDNLYNGWGKLWHIRRGEWGGKHTKSAQSQALIDPTSYCHACEPSAMPKSDLSVPTFQQLFCQHPTLTSPIFPPVPNTDQPFHPASTHHQPALPLAPNFGQPAHFYFKYSFPPSHISMARTKQSARKVTGGHAPRVNLEVLQKKKAKAKAASKKPPLKRPAKDNAVIICLDGGEICLIVSEESLQKVKKADVKFMCMTCHWQKPKNDPKPYMGFYSKGEPALSTPSIIPGGFHHAMTSQVAPHPTALLHLHLEGLAQDIGHSQVAMLHSFLQAYFPQGGYTFSQLSFNLCTPESMDAYDKAASDLANTLSAYSRVVLFLTTHSDEDRGVSLLDI
ncbi:hypothetical protein EDD17DRAFT_1512578 [Pisolithus thermaeus]|nr:hypothetical protein EDD17DRAFT_1512578 [Pisolithus thermaeus]